MSDCECFAVDGPEPTLLISGVKKDLDKHAKHVDVQCAEEILMQMVRTRTGGLLPPADGTVRAIESSSGGEHRDFVGKDCAKAKVKGLDLEEAVMTIDSSPERDQDARHKKDRGRHRSDSGSSSSRSRGRRRRGRSSSSSPSSPRRKRRINNFSSIRNVEKERAKTRGYRSAGAAAAIKIVSAEVQGPYFAP
mmetsp:Transcript_83719/g.194742  ORF Transcript_83719/g.194742 Transcript_83719/m.194742 type:complete len:192 (-) Transcript_83719:54-629(-)|eukprot:CAMPEP_0171093068 /NCGR_PEP_ID=MMETSP0766_2-20121228/38864_1 /TAXON_ID=439317 /ORGANISM="Gambierdiscus australes, Strain CAWD 149" /LENGTH=191 /DNA_ID=CAMNT_0011551453 /DNA_START=75 /DNA_END=650 /DNA_ORIENTATION=-